MNLRVLLVAFLAIVSAISAVVLVQGLRKTSNGSVTEQISVIIAASDIKPGEIISLAMVETRQIPKEVELGEVVHVVSDVIDRAALYEINKGEMIYVSRLAEKGAGRGMAAMIRPGMRGFTIQTPSFSSSLAGLIQPGNRVDVLLTISNTLNADEEGSGGTTTAILQNIEILAVHTTINTQTKNKVDPNDARSVTLMVTPTEASLLDFAQNKGTLHLSLRNIKDVGRSDTKPATMADIQLPKAKLKPVLPDILPDLTPLVPEVVTYQTRTLRGTRAGYDLLEVTDAPMRNLGVGPRSAVNSRLTRGSTSLVPRPAR